MHEAVIFLNGNLGLKVLKFMLNNNSIKLNLIVLNHESKRLKTYEAQLIKIIKDANIDPSGINIVDWKINEEENKKLINSFKNEKLFVSVLFGHRIPVDLLPSSSLKINLHPSFLPLGRGANPISWAILEGNPQGVSIHEMSSDIDEGPILFQKRIEVTVDQNAGTIYEKCETELYELFLANFDLILNNNLTRKPQNSLTHPRKKYELELLREMFGTDIDSIIKKFQALSFNNGSLPIYKDEFGDRYKIHFKLERIKEEHV